MAFVSMIVEQVVVTSKSGIDRNLHGVTTWHAAYRPCHLGSTLSLDMLNIRPDLRMLCHAACRMISCSHCHQHLRKGGLLRDHMTHQPAVLLHRAGVDVWVQHVWRVGDSSYLQVLGHQKRGSHGT